MNEIPFRSIFQNNNIPNIKYKIKTQTIKEKLSDEMNSLLTPSNLSQFSCRIKQLEFKVKVEEDPVNALLEKLKDISN